MLVVDLCVSVSIRWSRLAWHSSWDTRMLRDGGSLCCGVYENVFLNRV